MRAAVLSADRPRLETTELPDPTPGEAEALVRVTGCGVCGSDLHLASQLAPPGTVLGHEIAGVVEALGPGARDLGVKAGDQVAVRPLTGCDECSWCRRARADHCERFALLGLQRPGGFAELVAASARELFLLPAAVSPADHALVEPLAVARRAVRRAAIRPGEPALVLGGGPIGLAVTAWLRALGAGPVVVSEPAAVRRSLAEALGADATVDPTSADVAATAVDALSGTAPVVFECTGRPGLLQQGLQLAAIDGRVVVVGVCAAPDTVLPIVGLLKELDVRFALYYGREDFTDTIDALAGGRLDASAMVTSTVTLEGLPDAFAQQVAAPDGGKVVVVPGA